MIVNIYLIYNQNVIITQNSMSFEQKKLKQTPFTFCFCQAKAWAVIPQEPWIFKFNYSRVTTATNMAPPAEDTMKVQPRLGTPVPETQGMWTRKALIS